MEESIYTPVFLHPEWAAEKYYGWTCIRQESGLRVIRKRVGPVEKTLFMTNGIGNHELAAAIIKDGSSKRFGIDILHNFYCAQTSPGVEVGGLFFTLLTKGRQLNIGTFVIDLELDEEQLWKNLGQKSRNMVRKARECGAEFRVATEPTQDLDAFFSFYKPIVERLGLQLPSRPLIEKMLRGDDLLCLSAVDSTRVPVITNLVYLCEPYAYFLYGASAPKVAGGIGQFLQWETMRLLKERGYRWYDLGGVATTSPSDGIYAFKKALGSQYVDLGSEYRRIAPGVAQLYAWLTKLRGALHV
ncbi:MAG TPA: GNAT family N-acetyltransferase [Methylocella sp.]